MAVNPVLRQLVADGKATKNAQSGTQTKMTAAKSAAQSTPMRRSLSNQQKTTSGTKKTDALTSAIISTNQKAAQKKTNTAERGSKHYTNRANQQRRAQAQVVANQIKKNNAERANKYSLGKGVAGAVAKGVNQAAQGVASTLALAEDVLLSPFELLSGQKLGDLSDTAPLNKLSQRIKNEGQETQKKYADNVAKGGKAAELLDKYGSATVAAVPQAVMAYLTAGASAGASTAGLGAQAAAKMTPSMAGTIRRGVAAMAKDPNYWTAFSQVVGQSYDEAMDDMAKTGTENNKARTKAALYAMGNGLLNAAVEVGGGIQKLPEELKHGAAAWKAWVNSMVDEGKEEVVQGVIERAMQNSVYDKGNPLASVSDPDAILNPRTAAKEFAGGAIVGGVLGAGQIGAQKVLESRNNRATPQQPTQQAPGAQADVREGTYTTTPANAAEGTQNAAPGVETAAAKRVELILDDMLSHGYTTMTGEQVGPNSGYLTAKQSILGAGEQARGRGLEDVDAFDTPGDAVAGAVNTPFDAMQAKSDEFYPVNPNSAQRIQAEQRRAPSEVPVMNPDTGRNVEKTVSTILNSSLTSPEMATVYENAISGGAFDYDVVTDRSAVQQAQAKIARDGWREVANSFVAKAELGQRITKADTADAISAYNLAISEGDHKAAFELATAIADAAHDSAQMVQAMNLMNRLTPEGRLLTLRRLVDRMNDRAARQNRTPRQSTTDSGDVEGARVDYIDKVTGFTLSDELATNYLMAETDAERAAAWDAITTSIADQIPSTFMEKANFWRYTSMLTNPTTHIRNIMGNAIQMGARKIKNGIGTAIERAVIKDPSQRTKAVNVDKDLKAFAKGQYETDQSAAMGSGKYSDATTAGIEREIQSKRKMFKGEDVLSRAVQGIGDLNSRALDYEDVIFNRAAYVDSFAQALQAKGVTAAEAHAGTRAADVEAARAYAIEEAQRATYRNTTALSEALSQFGRYEGDNPVKRAGSFVADALFPFRKTPANILTTGLDYSPIGLVKGIKEALFDVKSGKCTASDAVDSLASGLTGTGILALGAYLAAEGLLHVRAGDDDKEEAFEKSMGGQDYAIQIGDKSYTLDWAVPAAMPLFAGDAIMESVRKGGGTFDALVDSLLGMQDVVLETSMLSSLNDLISYWSYADNKVGYLLDRAASSYAGQYIPTIGSKVASVFDDTVRKSYVEKGSGQVASDVNYFLQGAAKKVPGVRNRLQPSIDLWGNEVSNGSAPERVFQSFISPGFLKAQDNSPATQEIRRLAKATGESAVYPAAAEKSFMVNGETKYLTGEEYTKYAKTMGSTRKQIVENMLKSKGYQKLSDDDKAKAISYAYEYANVKGKQAVSSYKPSNSSFSKGALASVLPPDMYILYKVTADKDNNGRVTSVESAQALENLTGLTDRQRGKAWEEKNSTTKPEKNPFTGALVEAGASVSTSISILDKYRELYNADGMKPKEKAADFRAYVYGLGLTPSQIAAAQSTYTFFGSYPIEW